MRMVFPLSCPFVIVIVIDVLRCLRGDAPVNFDCDYDYDYETQKDAAHDGHSTAGTRWRSKGPPARVLTSSQPVI